MGYPYFWKHPNRCKITQMFLSHSLISVCTVSQLLHRICISALQNFHFQLLFDTSPFLSGCLPFHTTPNSVVLISHHPGIWTDDGIGPCPTGKHRTSGMLISLVSATLAPGCSFGHFDVVEHWLGVICDAPSRMLIASEGLYYRSFKWDLHTKTPPPPPCSRFFWSSVVSAPQNETQKIQTKSHQESTELCTLIQPTPAKISLSLTVSRWKLEGFFKRRSELCYIPEN